MYTIWMLDENGERTGDKFESTMMTAMQAVEQWADWDDFRTVEFAILDGEDQVVEVELGSASMGKYKVSGRVERVYHATKLQ